MLFNLKNKNQENYQDPRLSPKIEKIKTILKKVKFVAKNVIIKFFCHHPMPICEIEKKSQPPPSKSGPYLSSKIYWK